MSKAKPVVTKVNPNKANFWKEAKFFGLSLFSNDTCVEGRNKPWWAAAIVVVLSIFLAILPISITYLNKDGASFLNEPSYGYENSLVDFGEKLHDKNVSLLIQDKKLAVSGWDAAFQEDKDSDGNAIYLHKYWKTVQELPTTTVTSNNSTYTSSGTTPETVQIQVIDFAIYYQDTSDLTTFAKSILEKADAAGNATYSINTIFLGSDGFYAYKLPAGTGTPTSSYAGKWDAAVLQGKNLADLYSKDINGTAYTNAAGDVITPTSDATGYASAVLTSWKKVFTAAYDSTRYTVGWQYTGIFTGVFCGMALLMGLTIFLMTRGKSNPFRIYSFLDSMKIAWWAAFSPALLAMILSFIWPSWQIMFFIFLYGMRIMWMSMRSLRPQYTESK